MGAKCANIKDKVMEYLKLDRCMRCLPHFHDTGGFFVCVLRKNVMKKKEEEHKFDAVALDKMEKKQFERKNIWNDNCPYFKFSQLENYEVELAKLVNFYGLNVTKDEQKENDEENVPYFDVNELLIRGLTNPRSLWFVPSSIGKFITNPNNHRLRIVQSGCRAFVRHDTKVTEHACKWRLTQDGTLYLAKYLGKQIVHLPLSLFLIYCFLGKLVFEEAELWEDGKYKALVDGKLRTQTGGPCIMTLGEKDRSLLHMDVWQSLSGWKSMKRVDLMIKKQQILLLQNHLRDVYKDECMQINAKKYDNIHIDVDGDGRGQYNQMKNKKKVKKHKFKKHRNWKNRDWTFRKIKNDEKMDVDKQK